MILLDSNIIIYLRQPETSERLISLLTTERLATCNVVIAEVLGFPRLDSEDAVAFYELLMSMRNYLFDTLVTNEVIKLRRTCTIQLPDAIIAATAIVHNVPLWTHNLHDFSSIDGLHVYDPLA